MLRPQLATVTLTVTGRGEADPVVPHRDDPPRGNNHRAQIAYTQPAAISRRYHQQRGRG